MKLSRLVIGQVRSVDNKQVNALRTQTRIIRGLSSYYLLDKLGSVLETRLSVSFSGSIFVHRILILIDVVIILSSLS